MRVSDTLCNFFGLGADPCIILVVELPDLPQQASPLIGTEIGSPIEGATVGQGEDIERPAPLSVDHLHRFHIKVIHIGMLFPVHLDAYKSLIHQGGNAFVFKRFPFHHVAPVTGCISNANQQGFVFRHGTLQCLFTPGIPFHWIILVLKQIRAV